MSELNDENVVLDETDKNNGKSVDITDQDELDYEEEDHLNNIKVNS